MVNIKDLRIITPHTNGTRALSEIKNIARHHSAGTTGNWASFWNYWHKVKGWGTGGYHEIILRDGTVELCYDPEEITNGVGGQNSYIYNICLVGNGSFTAEQERVFEERARFWMKRLGLPASAVKGHNEFAGQSTACPGIDMNVIRKRLSGDVVQVSKPTPTPTPNKPTASKLATDGYMGPLTTKALQRYFNTPVDGIISKPSTVIKALQKLLGVSQDGYFGPITIKALQRRLGTPQDGVISKPSTVIKELQRRLNKNKL